MLVASAAVGLYAAAYGMRLPETRDLPAVAAAGFFAFALYNVALNHGQLTVSAGAASLIVASIPLFTSLLAVVFLGEHLGLRGWSGLAVGFCGVALITLGEEGGFGVNRGALFLLLSAASVSVYFALQKPYLEKYGALPFTAYAVLAGTLLLLVPFLPGLVREAAAAPPRATLIAAYLGISSAIVFATVSYVFERLPAALAGLAGGHHGVRLPPGGHSHRLRLAGVDSERLGDGGRGRRPVGGGAGQRPQELMRGTSGDPI